MKRNIKIKSLSALEIIDSRGIPTLEVIVTLENNIEARASVPSGASRGIHEAHELKDKDSKRFLGHGVLKNIDYIKGEIHEALKGKNVFDQLEIDETLINLDGTKIKERLGANTILGVSIACLKAASKALNLEIHEYMSSTTSLPIPMLNIINGGKHANNNLDIQEFMIVPINNSSFKEGLRKSIEVFHTLKSVLKEKNIIFNGVGDEGGYAPLLNNDEEAIELILEAIKKANYEPIKDFMIALDIASSEWFNSLDNKYYLPKSHKVYTKEELVNKWIKLANKYPIISIEDALNEDDLEGWKLLKEKTPSNLFLVGDDLFTTNIDRLEIGIKNNLANAILIKPNQIGTISETIKTINLAKKNNYEIIISHRSGETNDSFISSLAVATNAKYIKAGAPSRGERVAKYNALLRIEESIEKSNY